MPSYVVTGAAKGIGLEFVKQLRADSGNTVFALVRSKSSSSALESLRTSNITIIEADITDAPALAAAVSVIAQATGGKLDCLLNNAGVHGHPKETLDTFPSRDALEDSLMENFRVNTLGTIHATNAFLPLLRAGTDKKVVMISSGAADLDSVREMGSPGMEGYAISKAALNMAAAKYGVKLKSEGFVVLAIAPGIVETVTASERSPEEQQQYEIFLKKTRQVNPQFKGPIKPQESVKLMLEVIGRWTVEETGAFVSQYGNKQWF